MTIRGMFYRFVIVNALQLVLFASSAFAVEPTLSAIRQTSLNYLSLPTGSRGTYQTSDSKSTSNPYIVSIHDTSKDYWYFNPTETSPELNLALRYLARTGGGAIFRKQRYLGTITGDFIGNKAANYGGAIAGG